MTEPHIAIVTGSNKGIGQTIAEHLAKSVHVVVVNYHRDQAAAEQTLERVRLHSESNAAHRTDLGDR